jgi:hypothetical protein
LIGSMCVPSPVAMNELRKGCPSTVPLTFTSPRVPKKSTERGHMTKVHPPRVGLFFNVAVNRWSIRRGRLELFGLMRRALEHVAESTAEHAEDGNQGSFCALCEFSG